LMHLLILLEGHLKGAAKASQNAIDTYSE
jgi:hypothetical protein